MQNKDILGKAIKEYHEGSYTGSFHIHYRDGSVDDMPISVFFREYEDMPDIEQYALSLVKGSVLDVGAGAGAHSLELQNRGVRVHAIDYSEDCVAVMKGRGIESAEYVDVFDWKGGTYDTILLLMNGIGLAGTLGNLALTLRNLQKHLSQGGQILFDSSDVSYLYESVDRPKPYWGEIESQFEYRKERGNWATWLYVDPHTLIEECNRAEINLEIIVEDDTGLYLARIY